MDIFSEIISTLTFENRVILATIISTSGSTPASAFSRMLVKGQGTISVGTVGGGCLEGDVLQAAKRIHDSNNAEILTFHLNEDEFVQGLICGGSLDVLIEPLMKHDLPLFRELKSLKDEGEDSIVATYINSDHTLGFKRLVRITDGNWSDEILDEWKPFLHQSIIPIFQKCLPEELRKVHHRNETRRLKTPEGELLLEPVAGNPGLIVFGGGHVSKRVCTIASMAGFRVTVVDDREQFANQKRFPEAAETIAAPFPDAFERLRIKPSTFIVIVTRGHRYDEEILERVLATPAKYIGMIGSKKKVFTTYEHLVERGVPAESLRRIHAPMGIEIGATTAEEIGVSIVAELIAVRRGEPAPYLQKAEVMSDLFSRLGKKGKILEVRAQKTEFRR